MARKQRIHYIGAVYHAMVRGNDGQDIFSSDADRYRFYLLLQEGVEKFGHRIHAFCLMRNHVHLAVQVGKKPLSGIMHNLCFRYTQWVNFRQKRAGHLFQGRYKAIVVDVESYLAELVRYIHLNPARAGIVRAPEDYLWSGHRAYLGYEILPWLTTDWILSQFSQRLNTARAGYREFVDEGKGEGRRQEFHAGTCEGRILGDDTFIARVTKGTEKLKKKPVSMDQIIEHVCKLYGLTEKEIVFGGKKRYPSEARGMIAYVVRECAGLSLTELSRRLKRDLSSLSLAANKIVQCSKENEELERRRMILEEKII